MNEQYTRLGRMEAETAWKRGDGDCVARVVRENLDREEGEDFQGNIFWFAVSALVFAGFTALVLTVIAGVLFHFYLS